MVDLSEREIKLKIIEQAETIAKAICRGKDVELRKSANGVSVAEISKRVVARQDYEKMPGWNFYVCRWWTCKT